MSTLVAVWLVLHFGGLILTCWRNPAGLKTRQDARPDGRTTTIGA